MNHPPEVAAILSQQVKNPASGRALRRIRTPLAGVTDEAKRQKMLAAHRRGGENSQKARRKRKFKGKGALMKKLNAYRTANLMNHPNAIEMLKELEGMK